jgi:hypothetical protein
MTHGLLGALEVLTRHRVAFTVVGGVAAVLQGAALVTMDLDVVYDLADENVDRVMAALTDLDAHFRARADLRPQRSHMAAHGHRLLITRYGPLDMLSYAGDQHTYAKLAAASVPMSLGDGLDVLVVDLPMLIRIKEELPFEKDQAVLPLLRATLKARSSRAT